MSEWKNCSRTVYGIPPSHWHCSLENWEPPTETDLAAVQEFVGSVDAVGEPHLLITGEPGNGKTHLSVALYRQAVLKWGTSAAQWHHYPELVDTTYRAMRNREGAGVWETMKDARRLLVLDDLFAREPQKWELSEVLFRAIDAASRNRAALVVTSNLSLEEVSTRIKAHEMSRLLQNLSVLTFEGRDRRL